MATRGYFTLKSQEEDVNEPYIGNTDRLIEAYHDGYFRDILTHILQLPIFMAQKMANHEITSYKMELIERFILKDIKKPNFKVIYEELLEHNKFSGALDTCWDSIEHFLQITQPMMYNQIEVGVNRYGYPVDHGDSYFDVSHKDASKRNKDIVEIKIHDLYSEEQINEEVDGIVEELNKYLTMNENEFQFNKEERLITFSFSKIFIDVLSNILLEKEIKKRKEKS
jgi:hypothetical protein